MLSLHPQIERKGPYKCPSCGCQLSDAKDVFFQGQHVLADITCTCCDVEYYQTMPIGHGLPFPVSFTKDFQKSRYSEQVKAWRAQPLLDSMVSSEVFQPPIEIIRNKNVEKIVWLNCLDACYGHAFQKLLDAQQYLEMEGWGLIVVVPEGFLWMIPEGVAEIWVVKAPLAALNQKITDFDAWVKKELDRFSETKIGTSPIQPDASKVAWTKFLKHPRFDLARFQKSPLLVTFVWREDRFWHTNALEETLYLASKKFKCFGMCKGWFVARQMRHFSRLAQMLQKEKEKIQFAMVGLGASGRPHAMISDHRIPGNSTTGKETSWFPVLASSHVVVGVLGSSMLIPTALAASFVDMVPHHMLELMGEDIAQPYTDRKSQFLGRFLFGTPSVKQVTKQVLSILNGYAHFSQTLA